MLFLMCSWALKVDCNAYKSMKLESVLKNEPPYNVHFVYISWTNSMSFFLDEGQGVPGVELLLHPRDNN